MREVWLKKGGDRRLRSGHLWVFSNELREVPGDIPPGEPVRVLDHRGGFLAVAAYHPHALIAGRILSRREGEVDGAVVRHRMQRARELRRRWVPGRQAFRHVHGEPDGLPGLVVDRYGPLAVVQPNSAFAERILSHVLDALNQDSEVTGVLVRADSPARQMEGLSPRVEGVAGEVPRVMEVEEGGAKVVFSPWEGQKTGLFLDMRDIRDRLMGMVSGQTVLDLFSYVGQWGVRAALQGAKRVVSVDSSEGACAFAREGGARSSAGDRYQVVEADVFEYLRALPRGAFDVVICDPPAFIKNRRHLEEGKARYHRLNQLAARAVCEGGVLLSASCSHALPEADLFSIAMGAGRRQGREPLFLFRGGQSVDHPVLPDHPESGYLKSFALCLPQGEGGGAPSSPVAGDPSDGTLP